MPPAQSLQIDCQCAFGTAAILTVIL
jgi:hypothetical protein